MNGLVFVAALTTVLLSGLSFGQMRESNDASPSTEQLSRQCLSLSMSSPAKGLSVANTILGAKDASIEARILAHDCLGHADVIAGRMDVASADETKALQLLAASSVPDAFRANIFSNAGSVFAMLGDSHRAVTLFEEANTIGNKHNLPMAQIAALMNLAGLYGETLDDPQKADIYYRQAVQLAKPLHRDDVYMYFNYGYNLVQLKKYDEAIPILDHVIDISKMAKNLEGVRFRADSELATIYIAKGEEAQALPLLHDSISGLHRVQDTSGEAQALLTLADYQLSKENYPGALKSAQKVLQLSKQINFAPAQTAATHRLIQVYAALNQTRKALELSESVSQIEMGDLKKKNYQGIAGLEAELQNQASDYRNKELQAELQIQSLEVKRSKLIRNGLVALLLIILAFVAVLFAYHHRTRRALQALSSIDPLTGLYNRREIRKRLNLYQNATTDKLENQLALLIVDADHFKLINDRHGHIVGDKVLIQLAECLMSTCRDEDLVARWGGEEFLVCTSVTSPEDAVAMAERLRSMIERRTFSVSADINLAITVSIGFVLYPFFSRGNDRSWLDALHVADLALYDAKNFGRNAWVGIWGVGENIDMTAQATSADLKKAETAGHIKISSSVAMAQQ